MKIAAAASLAAMALTVGGLLGIGVGPDAVQEIDPTKERTRFVVATSSRLDPTKNTLFCATAPLFWNALEAFGGGEVLLDNDSHEAVALNASPFTRDQIAASAYVAGAGFAGDGTIKRLRAEFQEKFDFVDPHLARVSAAWPRGSLFAYAFLFKQVKWKHEFERLKRRVAFRWTRDGRATRTRVRMFGFEFFSAKSVKQHELLSEQVRVFDGPRPATFVVELSAHGDDRVLLAKVKPGNTLDATIEQALALTKGQPTRLRSEDALLIPVFDFDLTHDYPGLRGNITQPEKLRGREMLTLQTIRFRLDEKGVTLKSRMRFAGNETNPRPRYLVFDRPFLLIMKEKDKRPYFAMWVATPDLMVTE